MIGSVLDQLLQPSIRFTFGGAAPLECAGQQERPDYNHRSRDQRQDKELYKAHVGSVFPDSSAVLGREFAIAMMPPEPASIPNAAATVAPYCRRFRLYLVAASLALCQPCNATTNGSVDCGPDDSCSVMRSLAFLGSSDASHNLRGHAGHGHEPLISHSLSRSSHE